MKLYTGDLSPYSAKVRMQIYAMGIRDDFEFDLPIALFFSGRFRQLSPIGRIQLLKSKRGSFPNQRSLLSISTIYILTALWSGKRHLNGQCPRTFAHCRHLFNE